MAKYYVTSGELYVTIAGPHIETPKDAACEALLSFRNIELAPLVVVSEQGFDLKSHKQDIVFSTIEIAKLCGLSE